MLELFWFSGEVGARDSSDVEVAQSLGMTNFFTYWFTLVVLLGPSTCNRFRVYGVNTA